MRNELIGGTCRTAAIAWHRHELTYLLRDLADLPYGQIGTLMGGRDAATVIDSIGRVAARIEVDQHYRDAISALRLFILRHDPAAQAAGTDAAALLARRVMISGGGRAADIQTLALTLLTVASVLRSDNLTAAEARAAALTIIGTSARPADD